jgi:biopolymer transport protein TolR
MSAGRTPGGDEGDLPIITDINVTPMVDIMLVLLIIFMVTASLIVSPSLKVDLPKGSAAAATPTKEPDVVVVVSRDGTYRYREKLVSADGLLAELTKDHKAKPNARVLILADKKAYHGHVVRVMDIAKAIGYTKLGVALDTAR